MKRVNMRGPICDSARHKGVQCRLAFLCHCSNLSHNSNPYANFIIIDLTLPRSPQTESRYRLEIVIRQRYLAQSIHLVEDCTTLLTARDQIHHTLFTWGEWRDISDRDLPLLPVLMGRFQLVEQTRGSVVVMKLVHSA